MMAHIPQLPGCVVRGGLRPAQPPGAPRVSTSGSRGPEFRRGWHRLQPPQCNGDRRPVPPRLRLDVGVSGRSLRLPPVGGLRVRIWQELSPWEFRILQLSALGCGSRGRFSCDHRSAMVERVRRSPVTLAVVAFCLSWRLRFAHVALQHANTAEHSPNTAEHSPTVFGCVQANHFFF